MNTLVVSPLFPRDPNPIHGIFVKEYAVNLKDRGIDIKVVSPTPWVPPVINKLNNWKSIAQTPSTAIIDEIPVRYPRYLSLPGKVGLPISSHFCRHTIEDITCTFLSDFSPDIIHAHVAIPTGLAAVDLADHYDIPLITTIHGADFQSYLNLPRGKRVIQKVFNRSENVIVNSSKLLSIGQEEFQNTSFFCIPNGTRLQSPPSEPPNEIDLDAFTVVSVGNLVKSKGHKYLLDALRAVKEENIQCLIIGDGPERSNLEQKATELDTDVKFLGVIPNEDVFDYLWSSEAFVLPSYQEAFGIAYIEAMSCELPTIACKGEGPEDYIDHSENGYLVEKKESEEITNLLEFLCANPELREEVGKRARKTVVENFSWEIHTEKMKRVLQTATETYQSQS